MGLVKGGFLRLFQTFLYALAFCCAGIILGIFSYFLAALHDHNRHIPTWEKAVEGLAGSAVLYTIFAILLTCCLAGVTFFSFLGLVLDILFMGAMIAIAVMTRKGTGKCSGNVNTPLGSGLSSSKTTSIKLGTACTLNKAAFAVAVAGAAIFLITALMQMLLARHHKKDKAYGPSPSNNYTSGSTNRKFYQRKPKTYTDKDAELGAATTGIVADTSAGLGAKTRSGGNDLRASHDTAYTGSTVGAPTGAPTGNTPMYARKDAVEPGHGGHAAHVGWEPHNHGTGAAPNTAAPHGGYYTAPQTAPNPYGYDNSAATQPATGTAARNF